MDSAGSSPSHSFKDRPRSRHGELPRHSLPGLERKNSTVTPPKSFASSDKPDPGVRRSYSSCSLDKDKDKDKDRDNAESLLDSSRSSIRRPFPFKNSTDRFRSVPRVSSVDSRMVPLRGQEPDNGVRPGFRRSSSHGGGDSFRRELSDCSDERECSASKNSLRKCQDRDRSPDYDDDASRSPKNFPRRENRDAFRNNPNRDGALRGKDFSQDTKSPVISSSGSEKRKIVLTLKREKDLADLDDIDVTSPKPKFSSKDEGKDNCGSSADIDVRSWNKSSHGAGDDDEQRSEANASHGGAWREINPLGFSHISKRARSDRDRGRREEMVNKTRVTDDSEHDTNTEKQRTEGVEELDSKKEGYERQCDHVSEMKEVKDDAESSCRNPDATSGQSPSDIQPSHIPGDKSDVEEGELEPEADAVQKCNEVSEEKVNDIRLGEDDQTQAAVEASAIDCDEALGSTKKTDNEVESESNDHSPKTNELQNALYSTDNKCDSVAVLPVKEHGTVPSLASGNPAGVTKSPELKENQTALKTFDLLDVNKEVETWNLNSTDQGDLSSKQLTLSLFTKPDEVSVHGKVSVSKDHVLASSSKSKEVQIGKRTDRSPSAEDTILGLQNLASTGGESSQHSGHKQKKLKMDSGLLLSLALPGTSAMAAEGLAGIGPAAVGPMEPEKSMQSLNQTQTHSQTQMFSQSQTNSDGFASSFSFSQSQSFIHNPSCSLNCTSVENQELSCGGSRQVSQGTASWPALSGNEEMSNGMHTVTSISQERSKHRRGIPLYQRILQNGNVHQGFPSVTGSNRSSGSNHVSQRSHQYVPRFQDDGKNVDSSTQDLEVSAHQGSTHRDIRERVRQQKAYFASKQQALSGTARSEPNASQSRDKLVDPPAQSTKRVTPQTNDDLLSERNVLSENIGLHEIATEPVAVMAQKLQELPDSYLDGLKGLAKTTLTSFEKREELKKLQDIIRSRTDLTEDTLLRAHGVQLAIIVALKTGIPVYVQGESKQTYKALIDIFLQAKCRNIACQQSLPVGGCECRICSKKSGFCHDCMCVVCYKFDSDNNTCRWVGCDVCLHWCHTDCGLRMSYISPTPSTSGTSEMQYHCVACDHKSELFGFVKEVFRNCASGWNAEILARELDCVMRIFHGSEDMRGKQLCWQAQQMLKKLENKADAGEVCRSMLRFFNEGNADLDGANMGPNKKAPPMKTNEVTEGQENLPKAAAAVGGSKLMEMDKSRAVLQNFDCNLEDKRPVAAELQFERARKRAEIEDIESAVRIKQAEAKMFQIRADEARKEAGGLQRIIAAKREKIEEDFTCKYKKLRLSEAEERRQKRLEELQALENAQNDFHKMKIRMEAEIKELLLKMELAKRQFA